MAATAAQHLPDGAHQAGGGLSGKLTQVRYLSPQVLAHLQKIYALNGKEWTAEQTSVFLKTVQKDDDAELAQELAFPAWDIKSFLKYMTSSVTSVVAPPKQQDLSWPLAAYFISSSHNTYLTGNQLSSDSSADAYKNVLLRGCRCIEVDVWDGDEPDSDGDSSSVSSSDDEYTVTRKQSKRQQLNSLTNQLKNISLGKKLDKTNHTATISTSPIPKPVSKSTTTTPKKHKRTFGSSSNKTGSSDSTTGTPLAKTDSTSSNPLRKVTSLKEPRVLHGYTLTKEVSFRDVCMAIRDYGFAVSDTPLIVSLEVHCSTEQQETMVAIMTQIWEGLLVPEPEEDAKQLPTPEELRGKILVKVKYAPPHGESPPAEPSRAPTPVPGSDAAAAAVAASPKKPSKIIQALSKLGIYTRGVSFKSLTQPEATMPTHIFSLSENSVAEVHQKSARELFEHNRCFLMRAYPSGLRIRSSNLDPAVFWRKGVQVVALNWQNWDEGMMLNEGMFAGTGGYVLKPEGYRPSKQLPCTSTAAAPTNPVVLATSSTPALTSTTSSGPEPQAVAVTHYTMDLTIQIIAAQNLPLPPGDTRSSSFRPYVKVEIHVEEPGERHGTDAVPADGKEKEGEYKAKTKSVKGGCDPDWKGEGNELRFEKIPGVVPELSFVRFLIKDDEIGKDSLAGWACVRVDRLREGYRFLHVCDARGVETEGVVLVKVWKNLVKEV
ncbi:PLC-like phosphodiesterase [Cladorrhinum sp. PSN259]|nr:PLC-like phosphodiesterase [Cladorrhinum sp. PSN259]